jgi:type VI protein secretion system component VasK
MATHPLLRPPVLIPTGLAVFGATALLLFHLLGLSLLLAVLIVLTIVLIVVILLLFRQLRAARAAEEIEKTITRQADRDIERSVPGQSADAETMKAELLAAIQGLKGSRLGKRHGQTVLSTLPWYMVIGPAGAGRARWSRARGSTSRCSTSVAIPRRCAAWAERAASCGGSPRKR